MTDDEEIDVFNEKVKQLIDYTYNKFPNGCPFPKCRKDCILYQPTERTTHSVFCWFLTQVGERTILDLDSTEPRKIYR
jgi:hypothetical protein